MAEEELDFDLDDEEINRTNKRINSLSNKVKEEAEARAREAEARKQAEAEREAASKERDFYKGFNQIASKYQGAAEYQDKILEKVNSGYDIEDATISILAKEGKYQPQAPQEQPKENEIAAGGSASIGFTGNDKTLGEMTKDEKRAALLDIASQGEFRL